MEMKKAHLNAILATPLMVGTAFLDFHLKTGGIATMVVVGLFAYADAKNDIF